MAHLDVSIFYHPSIMNLWQIYGKLMAFFWDMMNHLAEMYDDEWIATG